MVDRQKELYQQQQQLAAHAAWASFGGGPAYSPGGGHSVAGAAAASSPYENYMQRLSQFAASQHTPPQSMFGSNFLGNGTKDMSSFSSAFLPPPAGHPMFPGLGNYSPHQMFWISAAQAWCEKWTEAGLRVQAKDKEYPPGNYRVQVDLFLCLHNNI